MDIEARSTYYAHCNTTALISGLLMIMIYYEGSEFIGSRNENLVLMGIVQIGIRKPSSKL